uniref:Uncharacterized protein n=1 Tax=Eutreptiella gymnastica TaxID=73025 RepID=A0A7S1I0M5_9EUGL|mmetsp:Transcript_119174/g.207429  ORF Transcript_119174/g.207429 Transcript_119174/m.207429 type:complete len:112 (+) Transcript_119174:1012-1347(+)
MNHPENANTSPVRAPHGGVPVILQLGSRRELGEFLVFHPLVSGLRYKRKKHSFTLDFTHLAKGTRDIQGTRTGGMEGTSAHGGLDAPSFLNLWAVMPFGWVAPSPRRTRIL